MSQNIKPVDVNKVVDRLGLKPGGKTHKYFMTRAAFFMTDFLPYRDKGSVVDALRQGIDYANGQFRLKGPHQKYLFYGKAMAGKPKRPIDKDLVYTKSPHPKAGPHYEKAMMQEYGEQLGQEVTDFARRESRG